ncbi:MAG: sugar ABC transporter permease, partial [Anaerolineae bacterium]|nr:sugar ABC transporter permease [Anaerolineae bacterium]
MATTSTTARTVAEKENARELAVGRFRSKATESVLGLLFVAPAVLVALIFQLLAVVYGFFISMQGGVLVPQGFIGLTNFVRAVGSLAYMIALALALVLALGGYGVYRRARAAMWSGHG